MAKMGKKFLGLSIFYWVLIVLVVLFFVFGGRKVSEGFFTTTPCNQENKTNPKDYNLKKCSKNFNKCRWSNNKCYCC